MGDIILRDPITGGGAHVDANSHLHTEAVTRLEKDQASRFGWRFNINTGDIAFTNATEVSVLYVKNTGDDDLVIDSLIYLLGNSTNGTGDVNVNVIRNPTAGAIITNANNVAVGPTVLANQNFGSKLTMTGDFFKGAQGEAVFSASDGATILSRLSSVGRTVVSLGSTTLPKGSSIGINYTPPTSNTSQTVQFAISCHIRHPDVSAP